MNFRDSICKHLAEYKVINLGITEDGIFRYRTRDVPKAHILPHRHRRLNILDEYRGSFYSSDDYKKIEAQRKFHRCFHHLNSSQALCINLFYPLMAESGLGLVANFIGIESAFDLQAYFEQESDMEKAGRLTHFDFYMRHSGGNEVFFEVKYTECKFARVAADAGHKDKFQRVYRPLVEKSAFLCKECRKESVFLENYQILRNLVHLKPTSHVVFLFPSANTSLKSEAVEAYKNLLTDAGRERARIIYLENIVSYFEAECRIGPLAVYYPMFRRKYLPPWLVRPEADGAHPLPSPL